MLLPASPNRPLMSPTKLAAGRGCGVPFQAMVFIQEVCASRCVQGWKVYRAGYQGSSLPASLQNIRAM